MNTNNYIQGLADDSAHVEQRFLQLADDMASAATGFNTQHGYDTFVSARSTFRNAVHDYYEKMRSNAEWIQKHE